MAAIAVTSKTDQPNSTVPTRVTRERVTLKSTDREQEGTTKLTFRFILHGLERADMGDLPRTAKRVASSSDCPLAKKESFTRHSRPMHCDLRRRRLPPLQQVQWDGVPHEPSPTTFLKTIEIKVLQPTPCHGERVASTARSSMLGKANEICRFQPSKLKGPGTSTSFCTGASASSLTLPSSPSSPSSPLLSSQQVQWDGVEARLRHQEGVPRTHGTRQHEPPRSEDSSQRRATAKLARQRVLPSSGSALGSSLLRGRRQVASASLPQKPEERLHMAPQDPT